MRSICSIPDCNRPTRADGLCLSHVRRVWAGRPVGGPFPKTADERFWAKVNKDGPTQAHMQTPCWVWTPPRGGNGHGSGYGRTGGVLAHRISYTIAYGTIDSKSLVLHHCDNPACVRPDHLYVGTPRDNARDRVRRGRHHVRRGEACNTNKLREEQVLAIRQECCDGRTWRPDIAERYGCTVQNITRILQGKTWRHLYAASVGK